MAGAPQQQPTLSKGSRRHGLACVACALVLVAWAGARESRAAAAEEKLAPVVSDSPKDRRLSLAQGVFHPEMEIVLRFTCPKSFPEKSWIGVFTPDVPHGMEAADGKELAFQHIGGRTSGTMTLKAPGKPGAYEVRMFDRKREVCLVRFKIALLKGNASLKLAKTVFAPGAPFEVKFTVPDFFPKKSWVGIFTPDVPRGMDEANGRELSFKYTEGRTSGSLTFAAPQKLGDYELRLFDRRQEVCVVRFKVALAKESISLKLTKAVFAPGETIAVQFTASKLFPEKSWVGIFTPDVPHGMEECNGKELEFHYLDGRTSGKLTFEAPGRLGAYEIRMLDRTREVTLVTLKVAAATDAVAKPDVPPTTTKPVIVPPALAQGTTFDDAIILRPGELQQGHVKKGGAVYYKFYLSKGQTGTVNMHPQEADQDLFAIGPSRNEKLPLDSSGLSRTKGEDVAIDAPADSMYYAKVSGAEAGRYTIHLVVSGNVSESVKSQLTGLINRHVQGMQAEDVDMAMAPFQSGVVWEGIDHYKKTKYDVVQTFEDLDGIRCSTENLSFKAVEGQVVTTFDYTLAGRDTATRQDFAVTQKAVWLWEKGAAGWKVIDTMMVPSK